LASLTIQVVHLVAQASGRRGRLDVAAGSGELIPHSFSTFRRQDVSDETTDGFGVARAFAKTWKYQGPNGAAALTFSGPLSGWQEPISCYRNTGWIVSECDGQFLDVGGRSVSTVEARVSKSATSDEGRLFLAMFDVEGVPASGIPVGALPPTLGHAASEAASLARLGIHNRKPTSALQLFIEGPAANDAAEVSAARAFFADACRRLCGEQSPEDGRR
jgi:hypothetical protein